MFRYVWIEKNQRESYQKALKDLCRQVVISTEGRRFYLDHGQDYFAFFDSLGEGVFLAAFDGEQMVAVSAAVLRKGRHREKTKEKAFWQIADFRVWPGYSHEKLGKDMLFRATAKQWTRARRGCALSLQPLHHSESAFQALSSLEGGHDENFLFALDGEDCKRAFPLLREQGLRWQQLSLHDKRRMVFLDEPAQPEMIHLAFEPDGEGCDETIQEKRRYVFVLSSKTEAFVSLGKQGLAPDSRVVVYQRRMKDWDWSWINSRDL